MKTRCVCPAGSRTILVLTAAATLLAIALRPAAAGEPRPDITIERWSTPATAPAGSVVEVVVHMTNRGQAVAGGFPSELRLDPIAPGQARIRPTRWNTESLKPGQRVESRLSLPIPRPVSPGEYVLRVEVDVNNAVREENEHNNLAERRLVVTPPRPPASPGPDRERGLRRRAPGSASVPPRRVAP
ncbi:MAG: CARDB domain-containing protein [Acidobacteriota bacterium]